jgi:hypothetical protein
LLLLVVGFWAYAFAASIKRARVLVLERESTTEWVRSLGIGVRERFA